MTTRTILAATMLTLTALTVGAPAASAHSAPSPYDSDLGIAVPYGEARDTTQAEQLAKWASAHDLTNPTKSTSLDQLTNAVTDQTDRYPGSAKVTTSLNRATAHQAKATVQYRAGKFATGDAQTKSALANLDAARTAMEADFDAALAKAGPSTAYRMGEGTGQPAYVEVASLASAAVVLRWVDGDTVLTDKGRVRLVGVDTPEVSDKCSKADEATHNANTIAPAGSTIVLRDPLNVQDKDKYGRLLRYVETYPASNKPTIDVGYAHIKDGLAIARYDGLDGFASHPRQDAYRAASQQDLARDTVCYLPLVALFEDGNDGTARTHVLTKDQVRTSRDFLTDDWKHTRSNTTNSLKSDRDKYKQERAATDAKKKRAAADAKKKRAAADAKKKRATTNAKKKRPTSTNGGSGASPGYTGPRCYAPGGKTWRPC